MSTFELKHQVLIEKSAVFRAIEAIDSELQPHALNPELSFNIRLALEELLLNLIDHAGLTEKDSASITIEGSTDSVSLTMADNAEAFDPFSAAEPDLNLPVDERPIGGLGLHLLKQNAHEAHYERAHGQNIIQLSWLADKS